MGLFGEVANEIFAGQLEKVLLKAIENQNMAVIDFCREQVYPLYCDAAAEAWGLHHSEDKAKIDLYFGKK